MRSKSDECMKRRSLSAARCTVNVAAMGAAYGREVVRLSAPLDLATTPYGLALDLKLVLLLGALGAAALARRAAPVRARRCR